MVRPVGKRTTRFVCAFRSHLERESLKETLKQAAKQGLQGGWSTNGEIQISCVYKQSYVGWVSVEVCCCPVDVKGEKATNMRWMRRPV